MYVHMFTFLLATSVTKIRFSFSAPRNTSGQNVYSITVTCIIHPDSTADQCVVMAMADGRVTRTSNENFYCYVQDMYPICTYIIIYSTLLLILL